jgi:hypothetical protein
MFAIVKYLKLRHDTCFRFLLRYSDKGELKQKPSEKPCTIAKQIQIINMKTTTNLSALLLAVSLTAALQAHATPTSFSESSGTLNKEVAAPAYYTGTFTEAGLTPSGYNNSDTLSSVTVALDMYNAAGNPVYLTIDGITQKINDTVNPTQILTYTLTTAEDNYIQTEFAATGKFSYTVQADCELLSDVLTLNTSTGQTQTVPDASSTVILLGGALSGLALLKRKLI